MKQTFAYLLILAFGIGFRAQGQNLIVNPGAELDPVTNGWIAASGTWSQNIQVMAHGGFFHFYAGNSTGTAELYQDVDVSSNATNIDAGTASYTFGVWMRIYATFNDRGRVRVDYLNASGTVLAFYDTGNNSTLVWTYYTNTRLAPVGTRTIRIRMFSTMLSGTDSDGYMDDFSLVANSVAPVQLISFTGTSTSFGNELQWCTSCEVNSKCFVVETSTDALTWKGIDTLVTKGSPTSTTYYSFVDNQNHSEETYYRLKQIDQDGAFEYSKAIKIAKNVNDELIVYPVPAKEGRVNVRWLGVETSPNFELIGVDGKTIPVQFVQNGNTFVLVLESVPAGRYIIRATCSNQVRMVSLLIE